MRKTSNASVHLADFIHVFPALRGRIVHRDNLNEVSLEKIFPEFDLGVLMVEVCEIRCLGTLLSRLRRSKRLSCDIEGQELGIHDVEDCWNEGCDDGLGCVEGSGILLGETDKLLEVFYPRGEVRKGSWLDVLHGGHDWIICGRKWEGNRRTYNSSRTLNRFSAP